ncbi:hypothetical protein [Actinomadura rupiterrae]|uniref:hypothetical protein n=1 Tax=Actinomadura rupiterrae TaxID=559627 RepID=UPI0020A5324A|nr:hypothetical protein [Actinomadura rupiterrae]MCP2343164.1 hypothetical protein [Actinomadura rupiterrae]
MADHQNLPTGDCRLGGASRGPVWDDLNGDREAGESVQRHLPDGRFDSPGRYRR